MVLNKHKDVIKPDDVYIGRGSVWGNPFVIGTDGDRDEVVEKYRTYLREQISNGSVKLSDLRQLRGKNLVCFCAPLKCHGDVLKKASVWAEAELAKQRLVFEDMSELNEFLELAAKEERERIATLLDAERDEYGTNSDVSYALKRIAESLREESNDEEDVYYCLPQPK